MFDFRYHALSLLAVFLALIVGIVIGVGLSGRGLVEESERRNLNRQIEGLERQLEEAQNRTRMQEAAEAFVNEAADAVVENRLRDTRVALLFVGSVDGDVREWVVDAVTGAGGDPVRMRALDVPVDPEAVDSALSSHPEIAGFQGVERLRNLGEAMGRELVAGGETPLWDALSGELVEERTGSGEPPVDGVVVARSVERAQGGPTARFLDGLYAGLQGDVPVVGVERSTANSSAIPVFRRVGVSSVDNVDEPLGRVTLVLLLAGGPPGHYGVKPTADGVIPPIDPLPPPEPGE